MKWCFAERKKSVIGNVSLVDERSLPIVLFLHWTNPIWQNNERVFFFFLLIDENEDRRSILFAKVNVVFVHFFLDEFAVRIDIVQSQHCSLKRRRGDERFTSIDIGIGINSFSSLQSVQRGKIDRVRQRFVDQRLTTSRHSQQQHLKRSNRRRRRRRSVSCHSVQFERPSSIDEEETWTCCSWWSTLLHTNIFITEPSFDRCNSHLVTETEDWFSHSLTHSFIRWTISKNRTLIFEDLRIVDIALA